MRRKDCACLLEARGNAQSGTSGDQIGSNEKRSLPSEPEWYQQKPARKPTVIQGPVSLVLAEKNERI